VKKANKIRGPYRYSTSICWIGGEGKGKKKDNEKQHEEKGW
jgi:hypothetical protein